MGTIFDKIVSGEIKSWIVWEDDDYMAFLTPFPNTPGFTVVIPKNNVGDYAFGLTDDKYLGLMAASKEVAKKLERAFDTPRVAMIIEGTAISHVHVKLIPLHGDLAGKTGVTSKHTEFHEEYQGYLTSAEGPKMDDSKLDELQKRIREA